MGVGVGTGVGAGVDVGTGVGVGVAVGTGVRLRASSSCRSEVAKLDPHFFAVSYSKIAVVVYVHLSIVDEKSLVCKALQAPVLEAVLR